MVAHAQLKEVHRQMDEWERKKRERAYKMLRPEEKGRKTEDTDKWRETRTGVQGWTAGNVITSMGNSQKGAPKEKEMLGRSAFVGGIAPGTSSEQRNAAESLAAIRTGKILCIAIGDRE
jgi:hypothetical protein